MAAARLPDVADVVPLRVRHLRELACGDRNCARQRLTTPSGVPAERYVLTSEAGPTVNLGSAPAWDRARVGFYFALWYALSVIYSVKNKQAHMALALPNIIATAQLLVGAAIAAVLWVGRLRSPPRMSSAAVRALLPIGLFHGIGHLTGVYATAAGSVSFVQVVKSAGPVWACLLSALLLGERSTRRVWLSLAPIIGGVALASAKELQFVWAAFLCSVASDVALALRNVLSKKSLNKPKGENMTPANTFYTFTILSALTCLPICLAIEGGAIATAWAAAVPTAAAAWPLLGLIAQGGLYFTLYSEVQFKALDQISPVTHAVGNTMRRVVIMVVCIIVFGTPMSLLGGVGSAIAIAGSYAYAMAKTAQNQQADKKAAAGGEAGTGRSDHPLLPLMKAAGRVL